MMGRGTVSTSAHLGAWTQALGLNRGAGGTQLLISPSHRCGPWTEVWSGCHLWRGSGEVIVAVITWGEQSGHKKVIVVWRTVSTLITGVYPQSCPSWIPRWLHGKETQRKGDRCKIEAGMPDFSPALSSPSDTCSPRWGVSTVQQKQCLGTCHICVVSFPFLCHYQAAVGFTIVVINLLAWGCLSPPWSISPHFCPMLCSLSAQQICFHSLYFLNSSLNFNLLPSGFLPPPFYWNYTDQDQPWCRPC
jgi:hypothetical protein